MSACCGRYRANSAGSWASFTSATSPRPRLSRRVSSSCRRESSSQSSAFILSSEEIYFVIKGRGKFYLGEETHDIEIGLSDLRDAWRPSTVPPTLAMKRCTSISSTRLQPSDRSAATRISPRTGSAFAEWRTFAADEDLKLWRAQADRENRRGCGSCWRRPFHWSRHAPMTVYPPASSREPVSPSSCTGATTAQPAFSASRILG